MSLTCQPKVKNPAELPDGLKHVLEKRFKSPINITIENESFWYYYFKGLEDGGVHGAGKVVEMVHQHGTVILRDEKYD